MKLLFQQSSQYSLFFTNSSMSSTFRIFATVSDVECRIATAYADKQGRIHEVYPTRGSEFASLGLWLDSARSKSTQSSKNWRIAEDARPAKPTPPPLTPLQELVQNLWTAHYLKDNLNTKGYLKRYSSLLYVLDNAQMKAVFFNSKTKTVYLGDAYNKKDTLEDSLENAKFFIQTGRLTFTEISTQPPAQPVPGQPIVALVTCFTTGATFTRIKQALNDAGFFVITNSSPFNREEFQRSLEKRTDIKAKFWVHTQDHKAWDIVYRNFWHDSLNLTEWIAQNKPALTV